jgi:hypothetical protein
MSLLFQPPPKEPPKASGLLAPRDLAKYKAWKYPTCNSAFLADESLLLPTAGEYADFLEWEKRQRAQRYGVESKGGEEEDGDEEGGVKGKKCGHVLHPGHPFVIAHKRRQQEAGHGKCKEGMEEGEVEHGGVDRCPMCTLQIHLTLLSELWDKWLEVGGPWRATSWCTWRLLHKSEARIL